MRRGFGERGGLSRRQKNDDARCACCSGIRGRRTRGAPPAREEQGPGYERRGTGNGRSHGAFKRRILVPAHLTNRTSNANKQPPIARAISFAEAKAALCHGCPFGLPLLLLFLFPSSGCCGHCYTYTLLLLLLALPLLALASAGPAGRDFRVFEPARCSGHWERTNPLEDVNG